MYNNIPLTFFFLFYFPGLLSFPSLWKQNNQELEQLIQLFPKFENQLWPRHFTLGSLASCFRFNRKYNYHNWGEKFYSVLSISRKSQHWCNIMAQGTTIPHEKNVTFRTKNREAYILGVSNGLCEHLRAVRLFLRARAVINYVFRAASTLKNKDGEQRALRKFSRRNQDLSLLKRNVLRQVIWLTPFNQSQQLRANCELRVNFSAVH